MTRATGPARPARNGDRPAPTAEAAKSWPLVGRRNELAAVERFVAGATPVLVLVGPAGTGKTRLLDEIEARALRGSGECLRVVASPSSADIPLGGFASLLPSPTDHRDFSGSLLGHAVAAINERVASASDGIVLVVDDAQWLDAASASLVHQVIAGSRLPVALALRSGLPVPAAITAALKDGATTRVDVGPLERPDVEALLREVLDGTIGGRLIDQLWRACEGNPLLLHELVLGALETEVLVRDRRGWTLRGELSRSPRLVEVVEARLAGLSDDERGVLELLAVSGPLGLSQLAELVSPDDIESIERRGLALTRENGRRRDIDLAHPLHGEVLRARLPAMAKLRINRRLAGSVEDLGARRRDDVLRVASWRLEGGGQGRPELMLRAAELAHAGRNGMLAERLARAAIDAGAGTDAVLLLSVVVGDLGRPSELEELLVELSSRPDLDDLSRAIVAAKRALNLLWGLQAPVDAAAVLDEAEAALPAGAPRDEVVAERAVLHVLSTRPREAIRLAEPLFDSSDPRVRVRAALALAPAYRLVGRSRDALPIADLGWTLENELVDQRGFNGSGTHMMFRIWAMAEQGLLADATALAELALDISRTAGDPVGQAWSAYALGRLALDTGRLESCVTWFEEAESLWGGVGQVAPTRWATSGRVLGLAMTGDLDAVVPLAAKLEAGDPGGMTINEADASRALAWTAYLAGDVAGSHGRLQTAVREALDAGASSHALAGAHDLLRLGAPSAAASLLSELEPQLEGLPDWPTGVMRATHIRAMAADDAPALLAVSDEYASVGMMLFAAEAAAHAAGVFRRQQSARSANRAAAQAGRLHAECEAARTPALADAGDASALSAREREIATLAASGLTNRAVAEQLRLSERTVENHLQRVYVKLGISARSGLAAGLGAPIH